MHPTLARFLDVGKAIELLAAPPAAPDPDAAAFLAASKADAALTQQLVEAKGDKRVSPDAQQALVVLAVRAAVARLADDAALGPLAKDAAAALKHEGATDAEVTQMLGTVLLEEGFSDEGDPDTFDKEYVRETLSSLPALARLDADKVDGLLEAFVESQPRAARPLALKAADALLSEAWGEGLQPLTREHAELTVEALWNEAPEEDVPRLVGMIEACLAHLAKEGLIGPARSQQLAAAAQGALAELARGGDDDDEAPEDEGDDGGGEGDDADGGDDGQGNGGDGGGPRA